MTNKKQVVLVTGGSGYIGTNLLMQLVMHNDWEIHATYFNHKGYEHDRIKWHQVNLLVEEDRAELIRSIQPRYLVHLAWKVAPRLKLDLKDYGDWVDLSKELVKEFYEAGGYRALLTGTCAEYDWNAEELVEGKTVLEPNNSYGELKKNLYDFMEDYCEKNNFNWVWPRLFFSFGPYQNQNSLVPSVIRSFLRNEKLETTEGIQEFDYLYIKDLVHCLKELIDHPFRGPINICAGETLQLKDIVLKIKSMMKSDTPVDFGALPYPESVPMKVLGSNELIRRELNWSPGYDLEIALEETIEYIKDKE